MDALAVWCRRWLGAPPAAQLFEAGYLSTVKGLHLAPSPSFSGWDHAEPGLWPAPEDRDVDLNAYPEPQWLARVAAAVRDHLRGHASDPVIGHGDWHPENLCWQGPHLIAVHDWDSVICQPEPAIAGLAAASFLGIDDPAQMASVEDSAAFLDAYQHARGRRWTSADYAACSRSTKPRAGIRGAGAA